LQRYLETGEARVIGGTTELVGLRNNGSEFPIELSLGEMHEGEERLFTGIIRDISGRKQIEAVLQRSEASLAAAQQMARLGSWEADLERGAHHWSDELYRVFGFKAQEFVPTYGRIFNAVHPEDKELVESAVRQALKEGKRFDVEFRVILPDGSERIVHSRADVVLDEASRPIKMLGTAHDITERMQTEKALRESEMRFRALVQNSSDIITVIDAEGTIRYVSPAVERVMGYRPEEQIGANAFDQVHADDREQVLRIFAEVLKKPGLHPPVEFRVPHKDGSWRHLEHVISNLLDDASIRGVVINSWDITERKQAEEEVRRLNATLEKKVAERTAQLADREHQLEELVGKLIKAQEEERRRVAYEVHDSLTQMAIATQRYIQTFADTHPPGSEVRPGELDRPLSLARQTVQEARRVVKGLRPTTLDDFGLATAVRQRVEELQDEGWEIGYEETLGKERLPAEVEITLYRVAQEALNNVQKHAQTTAACVKLTQWGRKIRLEVRDEGRGFDPSAVLGEEGPVERMGLSSMRERVALLGGELEIRSKSGAGTSVVAEVPLPATFEGRGTDHEAR
jgi:PAS domain S-box-containing protein